MNEFIGMSTSKKELTGTFDITDKAKTVRIGMKDIKIITAMLTNEDSSNDFFDNDYENLPLNHLKQR